MHVLVRERELEKEKRERKTKSHRPNLIKHLGAYLGA